jgi:Domain of unknown function (DUF4345)
LDYLQFAIYINIAKVTCKTQVKFRDKEMHMPANSIRTLQIATAVLGLIPVVTGVISMMGVTDPIYASANVPRDALLDSNLRFFGGLWLALGLALLWLIPRIDTPTGTIVFRMLWGMIFVGGVGRLLSMLFIGMPPLPFVAFTLLEIVGAPLFILWHKSLLKTA